jgi:mRNA export factor
MYSHEGPVLDLCWSADGSKLFSCGADKAARMFDLATNGNNGQAVQVGAHDAPIKCIRWIESPGGGILATGSWDKSVRVRDTCKRLGHFRTLIILQYWDLKSSIPVASVQTQERVYCMDVRYPLLVVGTAERHVQIINLNQPTLIHKARSHPMLKTCSYIQCRRLPRR